MRIEHFLQAINYNIIGGEDTYFKSLGENNRFVYSYDYNSSGILVSGVFNPTTRQLLAIEYIDVKLQTTLSWKNPEFMNILSEDVQSASEISYEEILEKIQNLYGTRTENIEVDFGEDLLFTSLKLAHEQDITFNEYMCSILRNYIDLL